ncbi:energy transducer TonB [Methyloradius palustris]|uniref:energy transducer TonB n=1 Tax=Methyloradius palustris TaxID=2778876 RepID=UPI001C8C8B0F|nr:energy transducer TonB [Methyloradius palustris]
MSLGLHAMLLLSLPNLLQIKKQLPTVLQVEMAKTEAPAPVAQPEPSPEPPAPQKNITPKPDIKPAPIKSSPAPINNDVPRPVEHMAETSPVISTAQKAEEAPVVVVPPPPPEPPKPVGPSQQDIDAARNQYGTELANALARYKQYPKIAQMRGYQGDVLVDVQMDSNGNVTSSKIHQSSGYESLDNQALDMVKKASPLPPPPVLLRGRSFNVLVPVSFHLQE